MKFSGDVFFRFALSVTGTYRLRFLEGKTEGAERTGCWTPLVNAHVRCDDSSTAITWAAPRNNIFYNKQVSIKRFLKRNLAHVWMVQCMNALADTVHKQEVPCTQ